MGLYVIRTETVSDPLARTETSRLHERRVNALLAAEHLPASWLGCRASDEPGIAIDIVEAPDEAVARAAADLIALSHATVEHAA